MFYLKNPKRLNRQSADMALNVSYIMLFQMGYVCKNPPEGGTNPFQLKDNHVIFKKKQIMCGYV